MDLVVWSIGVSALFDSYKLQPWVTVGMPLIEAQIMSEKRGGWAKENNTLGVAGGK